MAIVYFLPTATDLSDTASYSSGALPNDGDTLEFREGSQAITAGLTGLVGKDLAAVRFLPGFKGTVGAPGSVAVFKVSSGSTATLEINSGGAYINVAAHTVDGIDNMIVRPNSGSVNIGGTGTIASLKCHSSNVFILAGAVVTALANYGAVIDADLNATGFTTALIQAGSLNCKRAVTTLTVDGIGVTRVLNAVAVTTANLRGNGLLNYRSTGTLGTCNMDGASVFTPSGALTNVTLTTLNINSALARFYEKVGSISCTPGTTNNPAEAPVYRDNYTGPVSPFD